MSQKKVKVTYLGSLPSVCLPGADKKVKRGDTISVDEAVAKRLIAQDKHSWVSNFKNRIVEKGKGGRK